MTYRNAIVSVLVLITFLFSIIGQVIAATNRNTSSNAKLGLTLCLQPGASISEVTNSINEISDRYRALLACQLRGNTNLTKRLKGNTEFFEYEPDPGVRVTMSVFGEFVSSVKAEDTNKTGYTLNYYVSSGGPRGLFAYSQSKAGKGDGPYVEFYRTGAVRALFWFKDGLLTQGKIWETNGILQESKVFNPAIDILKEGALFRAAKHK